MNTIDHLLYNSKLSTGAAEKRHLKHIPLMIRKHLAKSPNGITPKDAQFLLKRKELLIFNRDLYTCSECQVQKAHHELEICHVSNIKGGLTYELEDDKLITICLACLCKDNFRHNNETHVLESLYYSSFSSCDLMGLSYLLDNNLLFVESLKKQIRLCINSYKSNSLK